jgi:predicted ATP-dependent serine protease
VPNIITCNKCGDKYIDSYKKCPTCETKATVEVIKSKEVIDQEQKKLEAEKRRLEREEQEHKEKKIIELVDRDELLSAEALRPNSDLEAIVERYREKGILLGLSHLKEYIKIAGRKT